MEYFWLDKLMKRISETTDSCISVTDKSGYIIASTKEENGSFCEEAFELLQSMDDQKVDYGNSGTNRQGIYYTLMQDREKAGVIYMEGQPELISETASIIRTMAEMLLEYETDDSEEKWENDNKSRLLRILVSRHGRRSEWEELRILLHMDDKMIRIPVLLNIRENREISEEVFRILRENRKYTSQDMGIITEDGDILLYKAIDENIIELMEDYKYILAETLSECLKFLRASGYSFSVYVGTFQCDFQMYRMGFEHCLWLKQNMGKQKSSYFYDEVNAYFISKVSVVELEAVYDAIEKKLDQKFILNFMEIIGVLRKANYNLNTASQLLHVHRNTFIYRLDKIRNTLKSDPLGNNADREFINHLYYYIKKQ